MDKSVEKIDLGEQMRANMAHYKTTLAFLGTDVPLEALCLPKSLEKILFKIGISRVCDLIGRDFTEIEGLGSKRLEMLTARLDEFLSINF